MMKLEMSNVNVERGSDRRMLRICRRMAKQELTSRVTVRLHRHVTVEVDTKVAS